MNLSDKTVGFFDLGLWTENCLKVAQAAKEGIYHCPNYSAFPEPFKHKIGQFEGMDISMDFFDDLAHDRYDMVFVPDTKCKGVVNLCRKIGIPTAGVGDAEVIETDRWATREYQETAGLPWQLSYRVIGCLALTKFFLDNPGEWYVKVPNDYRGIEESFPVLNPTDAEPSINHLRFALGPYAEEIEFLVEEMLKGPEPGMDFISRSGALVLPTQLGYEEKGTGIVMRTYWKESEVPPAMMAVYNGIAPEFKRHNMNFFSSFETRMSGATGKVMGPIPFPLDWTHRLAGPGTAAIQSELMENYPEVVAGLAFGEPIDPVIKHKYAAACAAHSEEAMKGWLNVSFPPELRQWIKFRMGCQVGKNFYAVPKFDSVLTVIGFGDTVDEALGVVKDRMELVNGKRLDKGIDRLMKIKDSIAEGQKCGINF